MAGVDHRSKNKNIALPKAGQSSLTVFLFESTACLPKDTV